tara:strand:+ start:4406 stop:6205 length:1800 start_codon:yes stop_codon:yes gene_type:complete
MANRRNLQNLINQRLKSDAKKEALENLENNDIELVREQLETKRNTTIGTDFVEGSIGGFKPLETVQSFKGQVIQGEGACEIIPEEAFSTESLIDPKTETLTAGTINFTNNFATITDGTGTPTSTITGGDSDQPIADIVGDLTGMPSLKTEKKKFGMNLVGAGSPEGLKAAFEKGQDMLGKTNDALSLAHNAAGGLKFVKNNLGDAAKDKAMEAAMSKISGLPDLNKVIPNPEDLAAGIENTTGNKALTMKTKVAKAKLAKFAKIAAIVGTVAAFKDDIKGFVDKAKSFVKKNLAKIATGLIVGGVLQEVSEKVNQGLKNKVTESIGTELPPKVQEKVNEKVAEGKKEEAAKEIEKATGVTEESDVERIRNLVDELNPTISGTLVKDADFYGQPTQLGDNIPKWAGERTGDEVFTYVSSVEELNSEIMSISRPLSEVIVHGSETQSNKNIGSIEINNIHKKLGHDGIVYHYVIRRDGRLQRGRPADRESEHTNSHNKFSLAVCLVGGINLPTGDVNPLDNRSESAFTREQFTTLERFLEAFFMKVPGGLVFGHNELESDVDDPYFSVMDYVEKNFRKSYDRVNNSFEFDELDPEDVGINK